MFMIVLKNYLLEHIKYWVLFWNVPYLHIKWDLLLRYQNKYIEKYKEKKNAW